MYHPYKWGTYLYLVDFAYNNRYNTFIKMNLFEFLYGRKWNSPINWENPIDRIVDGSKLLKEMEEWIINIR